MVNKAYSISTNVFFIQKILIVFAFAVGLDFSVFAADKSSRKLCYANWNDKNCAAQPPQRCDSVSAILWALRTTDKLRLDGYWLASFDSVRINDSLINLYLFCGQKWSGGIAVTEYGQQNSKLISPLAFKEKYKPILLSYADNGYPFVRCKLDDVFLVADTLRMHCAVDTGLRMRFGAISFAGNVLCDSLFWYRQCNFKRRQWFSQTTLDEACQRIEETGFARCAALPEISLQPDTTVQLSFQLQKMPSGQFDGLVGLAQNQETKKLELTGNVLLSLKNALHYGEDVSINWQKAQQGRLILQLGYEQLYLFGSAFGAKGQFSIEKTDTLQTTSFKRLNILYSLQSQSSLFIYASNKSSNVLSYSTADSLQVANSSFTVLGGGLQIKKLDYIYNPSAGLDVLFEMGSGNKTYQKADSTGTVRQMEAKINIAGYIPLAAKQWVLKLANKTALIQSSRMFYNELYFFGGNKNLRGFLDDQLRASAYTIATAELRFLFNKNSNFYAFFDQSLYKNEYLNEKKLFSPFGCGLGVQLRSKNNVFSLCYAVGSDWQQSFDPLRGKVHFGFVTLF